VHDFVDDSASVCSRENDSSASDGEGCGDDAREAGLVAAEVLVVERSQKQGICGTLRTGHVSADEDENFASNDSTDSDNSGYVSSYASSYDWDDTCDTADDEDDEVVVFCNASAQVGRAHRPTQSTFTSSTSALSMKSTSAQPAPVPTVSSRPIPSSITPAQLLPVSGVSSRHPPLFTGLKADSTTHQNTSTACAHPPVGPGTSVSSTYLSAESALAERRFTTTGTPIQRVAVRAAAVARCLRGLSGV
jgi:hypothetical protein